MSMHMAPVPHMTPHHYSRNIAYGLLAIMLCALGIGAVVQLTRPSAQPIEENAPFTEITQAWQAYRAGERTAASPLALRDEAAWQAYRAGERAAASPLALRDEAAWQAYRAGERAAASPLAPRDEAAWQAYRAGEHAAASPLAPRDEAAWQAYRAGERLLEVQPTD